MLAIDTETTGLWFKHGCQTFAIGIYNGTDYNIIDLEINPLTRTRKRELTKQEKTFIKDLWYTNDICMFNSKFDVKALINLEIFNKEEPYKESFWSRIIDTHLISHICANTEKRDLKTLSKKFLDVEYESVDKLEKIVNSCRTFIKSRNPLWIIADENSHNSIKPATKKWNKMDMWLPKEIFLTFNTIELSEYFERKNIVSTIDELYTVLTDYLKNDCEYTYELTLCLCEIGQETYEKNFNKHYEMNSRLLHVTYKMEDKGITIHNDELNSAIEYCNYWINITETAIKEIGEIQEITPTTLSYILYDKWQLPISKETKKTKKPSTDIGAVEELKSYADKNDIYQCSEFLKNYIVYKKYLKKLEYLKSYNRASIDGKIYPSINLAGTATTRVSSSDPNEQNISKIVNPYEDKNFPDISEMLDKSPHLRSVFGPPKNKWWLSNDYNQLQLRIFAVVTNEEEMIDKLNKGYDAHDITARRIYGIADSNKPSKLQRRIAKNVNFGFIFGASPKKIELTAGVDGLWDTVCEMFPNAHYFIEETKSTIRREGIVYTIGGYPLSVPLKFNQWRGELEVAAHAAVCYIIQGTEGEIVKKAMYDCDKYLEENYNSGRIVMQVHDELNFEMPKNFPKKHAINIKNIMEESAIYHKVNAPVNSEIITHSWNKGVEIKL